MPGASAGHEGAALGSVRHSPTSQLGKLVVGLVHRHGQTALGGQGSQRIKPKEELGLGEIGPFRLEGRHHERSGRQRPGRSRQEHRQTGIHALQDLDRICVRAERGATLPYLGRLGLIGVETLPAGLVQHQVYGVLAAFQILVQGLVEGLGLGEGEFLGHQPTGDAVAQGLGAPEIGPLAGQRILERQVLHILRGVDGLEGDALIGGGEHLLLEGSALQEAHHFLPPLFQSWRREFGEKRLLRHPGPCCRRIGHVRPPCLMKGVRFTRPPLFTRLSGGLDSSQH